MEFSIKCFDKSVEGTWVNFVKGMIKEINKDGYQIDNGFDLYIYSTLPIGVGLASSASLEVLVGTIINDLFSLNYKPLDLVLISQRCENNYIGVQCGIMDQYVIGMSILNNAMLIDTRELLHEHVNLDLDDYTFIIGNTNLNRSLVESKYNERRIECEKSLEILKEYYSINNLCNLSSHELHNIKKILPSEKLYNRVVHVITENERVKRLVKAIKTKNFQLVGSILYESHNSLKNNYEVTGKYLDCLVESFERAGSLGARMTGAGFGGCVIALIQKAKINDIMKKVDLLYHNLTGLKADFYIVKSNSSTRKIN